MSSWIDLEFSIMNKVKGPVKTDQITLQDCINGRATVKLYQEYLRKLTSKIKSKKDDHIRIN